MNAYRTTGSCGICEISELRNHGIRDGITGKKLLESFLRTYEAQNSRRTVILFSDNFQRGAKGSSIARELEKHPRLGKLITTGKVKNRNTNRQIQAWMFITSTEYGEALAAANLQNADNVYFNWEGVERPRPRDIFKQFLSNNHHR